jgi:2-keto-3-deoxy-L-rhamnonate aldolase RhmA
MPEKLRNTLKEKLESGEPAIGAIVTFPTPEVVEILGSAGFDWLQVEMEHAPLSMRDTQTILQVAEGTGTFVAVRVTENQPSLFKQVLDLGALGVVVPLIGNAPEAERAVASCRYPPQGTRGFGPRRASDYNTRGTEYFRTIESNLSIIPIIETKEAVDNIEQILAVDGIDTFLIGPADLSISLGVPLETGSERFLAAVDKVLSASKKAGKAAGIGTLDPLQAKKYIRDGFQLILAGGDIYFLVDRSREVLRQIRG